MRLIWLAFLGAGAVVGSVSLLNASWLEKPHGVGVKLIAHGGVHQAYDHTGLARDDCTATRILPPSHEFLENTIPSIREAFRLGADMVEIDIQPTADNAFVVFGDERLDCRTEADGLTSQYRLQALQRLDVGYGYTPDGGRTFPFRGLGKRMMPSLAQVLTAFGNRRFLINIKGSDAHQAEALATYLEAHDIANPERLWIYGRGPAIKRMRDLRPEIRAFDLGDMQGCTTDYMLMGWAGVAPKGCRGRVMMVPLATAHHFWGWPNKFLTRMKRADIEPVLLASAAEDADGPAVNSLKELGRVETAYTGWILTDRIEVVGPAAQWRSAR